MLGLGTTPRPLQRSQPQLLVLWPCTMRSPCCPRLPPCPTPRHFPEPPPWQVKLTLYPKASGCGITANNLMREICKMAGIHDIGIKVHGSRNVRNAGARPPPVQPAAPRVRRRVRGLQAGSARLLPQDGTSHTPSPCSRLEPPCCCSQVPLPGSGQDAHRGRPCGCGGGQGLVCCHHAARPLPPPQALRA